jgi:hypothetical protein
LSYAIVCLPSSVSLNNEKNCCVISEDKIAVCEKTAGLRCGKFSDLNSACSKVLVVPIKIFQFQDMLNENRFLGTFRGHSKRPNCIKSFNTHNKAELITAENIVKQGKPKEPENHHVKIARNRLNDLPRQYHTIARRVTLKYKDKSLCQSPTVDQKRNFILSSTEVCTANKFTNHVFFEIGTYPGKPSGRSTSSLSTKFYTLA